MKILFFFILIKNKDIYNKQTAWAVGSDIDKINELIKKIGLNNNLNNKQMDACLKNDKIQDFDFISTAILDLAL